MRATFKSVRLLDRLSSFRARPCIWWRNSRRRFRGTGGKSATRAIASPLPTDAPHLSKLPTTYQGTTDISGCVLQDFLSLSTFVSVPGAATNFQGQRSTLSRFFAVLPYLLRCVGFALLTASSYSPVPPLAPHATAVRSPMKQQLSFEERGKEICS